MSNFSNNAARQGFYNPPALVCSFDFAENFAYSGSYQTSSSPPFPSIQPAQDFLVIPIPPGLNDRSIYMVGCMSEFSSDTDIYTLSYVTGTLYFYLENQVVFSIPYAFPCFTFGNFYGNQPLSYEAGFNIVAQSIPAIGTFFQTWQTGAGDMVIQSPIINGVATTLQDRELITVGPNYNFFDYFNFLNFNGGDEFEGLYFTPFPIYVRPFSAIGEFDMVKVSVDKASTNILWLYCAVISKQLDPAYLGNIGGGFF